MADMDVDVDTPAVSSKKDELKKRFEVKKVRLIFPNPQISRTYTAACSGTQLLCGHGVSLSLFISIRCIPMKMIFADIVVDNCAICRNHIMDLCL